MEYRIARWWSANNRPDNCCINLPKKFVDKHHILDNEYVIIRDTHEGILIQPLAEVKGENAHENR